VVEPEHAATLVVSDLYVSYLEVLET
jgi:hypothetical protein